MHKLDAPLRPSSDVVARRLDQAGVLVHLGTNNVFELNETGIRIWELIVEGNTVEQIVSRLVDEFDVDSQQATTDLSECLERFRREGFLL